MQSSSLIRVNQVLFFSLLLVSALYLWRSFLIPITFGLLLAMLLLPVCGRLERWKVPRVLAILICLLMVLVVTVGILAILSLQISNFLEDLPRLQAQLQALLSTLQEWIEQHFAISPRRQIALLRNLSDSVLAQASALLSQVTLGTVSVAGEFMLVLVLVFFFLFNRTVLKQFILWLVTEEHRPEAALVLRQISKVSAQYLTGILLSMSALATLDYLGFLLIGLEDPLLTALLVALPTIIPYVGPLAGGFLAIVFTLASGSTVVVWQVVAVVSVAQAIQNYTVDPLVLGSSLNMRPFMTVLAIILGGLLWGASGMILFVPLLAATRILFEHIPVLHPFAFLIGSAKSKKSWMRKLPE